MCRKMKELYSLVQVSRKKNWVECFKSNLSPSEIQVGISYWLVTKCLDNLLRSLELNLKPAAERFLSYESGLWRVEGYFE